MRFDQIKEFKVEELLLDKGNYRFIAASDQKECIRKIHDLSPANFRNLMTSIAEDDLGELLLVYQTKSRNIVLDGNRRLAALKVLSDPKKYAPNESIRKKAVKLSENNSIRLAGIQAQVSPDKKLILKTVYERHAAGKGRSRIDWKAYGAAMFRYEQKTEDGQDWYSIALILAASKEDDKYRKFIESKEYSHETFSRVFKKALSENKLSRSIYSDRDKRIKKSSSKELLEDSIDKARFILDALLTKELTLSRSGNGVYADKEAVEKFVNRIAFSPDNERTQPPNPEDDSDPPEPSPPRPIDSVNDGGENHRSEQDPLPRRNGIKRSTKIEELIGRLNSSKLASLYNSLCVISLEQHPTLMYAGAACFFESLAKLHGAKDTTTFLAYFDGRAKAKDGGYNLSDRDKKDLHHILDFVSKQANIDKHSAKYVTATARQLRNDFQQLDGFIITTLESICSNQGV